MLYSDVFVGWSDRSEPRVGALIFLFLTGGTYSITLFILQSRFGDKSRKKYVPCLQNGTAVLKIFD